MDDTPRRFDEMEKDDGTPDLVPESDLLEEGSDHGSDAVDLGAKTDLEEEED